MRRGSRLFFSCPQLLVVAGAGMHTCLLFHTRRNRESKMKEPRPVRLPASENLHGPRLCACLGQGDEAKRSFQMNPASVVERARRMMTAVRNFCRAALLLLALAMVAAPAVQAKTVSRGADGKLPSNLVSYVRPSYPYVARLKEWDRAGSFRVQIDAETGMSHRSTPLKRQRTNCSMNAHQGSPSQSVTTQ